jgi:hypothetical protein
MPARPKKLLKKKMGMSEIEVEFLITGDNMFTGDHANFENEAEVKKAYRRYRPMLLLLRDRSEYPDSVPYFESGQRFWAYYEYDIENGPELYRKFQTAAMKGNFQFEFDYLKKSDLLEPDEEKKFHELMAKRLRERSRLSTFSDDD